MTSKEALEILSDWANGKTKLTFTQNCELYNIVLQDLDRLEKYKIANTVFISYLTMFNDVSFDTFITSQCTEEEQEICREMFKEVLENDK